jgi:hypothetical protein
VSADKRIPMVDIDGSAINEFSSQAIEGITRPIAEDLSIDAVAKRLLVVLNGQTLGEDYGKETIRKTISAIING